MNLSTSSSRTYRHLILAGLVPGLLLFAVLLMVSEWFLDRHVIAGYHFYQQSELFRRSPGASIVVFGDSHMSQGFVADENSLNMALAGENIDQISTKLFHYLKTHERPDLLILQLSPHMFATYRQTTNRRDYDVFFGEKQGLQGRLRIFDPDLRSKLLDLWRVFLDEGQLVSSSRFTERGSVLSDYKMSSDLHPALRERILQRVITTTPEAHFATSNTARTMEALVQDIKARGIATCIVSLPVTPAYRDYSGDFGTFEKAFTHIEDLASAYGLPYFNYAAIMDDYRLYRNEDHLNTDGATLFTQRVLSDCLALEL